MNKCAIIVALALGVAGGLDGKAVRMQRRAKAPSAVTLDAKALNNSEFQSLLSIPPSVQQLKDGEYAVSNLCGEATEIFVADKGADFERERFKINQTRSLTSLYIAIAKAGSSGEYDSYVVKYKHRYVLRLVNKQVVLQEVKI